MSTREVVILSGVRSAVGTYGGSLKDIETTQLGGKVIAEAVARAGVDKAQIGHCVMGNVVHTDRRDMYLSRQSALNAGLPVETPAVTVNRLCGSGLQAIVSATQLILLDDCDAAVAGGAEVMSRVPYWIPAARWGARMGDSTMVDAMTSALTCPASNVHMGITAENIAKKWDISRQEQDELAVESHRRAQAAIEAGYFESQILPIEIKSRKSVIEFKQDEHVRFNASLEDMAKLRPAFDKEGSVTAGNASGINDAAAAIVMMEAGVAKAQGLKPMARVVAYAFAGVEPEYMGIGPVPAVKKVLTKAGLQINDIDVWEVNEAFAAQALAVVKDLGLDPAKVNPNGSGISLGHPIGATGALITVKALYELERIGGRYAGITMCIGGGQGIAMIIEKC